MTRSRKGDMMFDIITNVIIEQNKQLLKLISKTYHKSYLELEEKYIRQEYYLPLVKQDVRDHCGSVKKPCDRKEE